MFFRHVIILGLLLALAPAPLAEPAPRRSAEQPIRLEPRAPEPFSLEPHDPASLPEPPRPRPTIELLDHVVFSLGDPRPPSLPFVLESGKTIRDDDVIRSAIAFDKRIEFEWSPLDQWQFEAGYSLTYLSANGPTPAYRDSGPVGGLRFEW